MYINELSLNLTSSCITFDLTTPEKNNIRMLEPIWMFTKVKPNWDCAIIAECWHTKEWKKSQVGCPGEIFS